MDQNPNVSRKVIKLLKELKSQKIPYECRVQTITKEHTYADGTIGERTKTKVLDKEDKSGIYTYPQRMQGHNVILGNTSWKDQVSHRKRPRYNNKSRFITRKNGKTILIRPFAIRVLTKEAYQMIREGLAKMLYDGRGFIQKVYLKTFWKLPV